MVRLAVMALPETPFESVGVIVKENGLPVAVGEGQERFVPDTTKPDGAPPRA